MKTLALVTGTFLAGAAAMYLVMVWSLREAAEMSDDPYRPHYEEYAGDGEPNGDG